MDDKPMNDTEALQAIGELVVSARVKAQKSQLGFAKETGLDVKTLRALESGKRWVQDVNRAKIETALGWRARSIQDVWDEREAIPAGKLTEADMTRGAANPSWAELDSLDSPVSRASLLTDEELLAEISYRFRNYKVRLSGDS